MVKRWSSIIKVYVNWVRKPKIGSTLNEIGRYVFEKYIKKKYVKNRYDADPLTCYKNGMYNSSKK